MLRVWVAYTPFGKSAQLLVRLYLPAQTMPLVEHRIEANCSGRCSRESFVYSVKRKGLERIEYY